MKRRNFITNLTLLSGLVFLPKISFGKESKFSFYTRENCMWKTKWDYLESQNLENPWVNYLSSKINQMSAQVHRSSLRGGARDIIIHPNQLSLISKLPYYDKENNMVGGRYNIHVTDEIEENLIFVYRELDDTKVVPFVKLDEHDDNIIREVSFREGTNEEVNEFRSRTTCYVEVINYENN